MVFFWFAFLKVLSNICSHSKYEILFSCDPSLEILSKSQKQVFSECLWKTENYFCSCRFYESVDKLLFKVPIRTLDKYTWMFSKLKCN